MQLFGSYLFGSWSDEDDRDGASSSEEEVDYMRRRFEEEDMDDVMEEESVGMLKRKRNTGKRPGGTNFTGRPDYWTSTWGMMLRNPELTTPGSKLQKMLLLLFE